MSSDNLHGRARIEHKKPQTRAESCGRPPPRLGLLHVRRVWARKMEIIA